MIKFILVIAHLEFLKRNDFKNAKFFAIGTVSVFSSFIVLATVNIMYRVLFWSTENKFPSELGVLIFVVYVSGFSLYFKTGRRYELVIGQELERVSKMSWYLRMGIYYFFLVLSWCLFAFTALSLK